MPTNEINGELNDELQENGYDKAWYVDGKRHRLDDPADIGEVWYQNGKLHRIDGPAVIDADGSEGWYVNGKDVKKAVIAWVTKTCVGPWKTWTDVEKKMFRDDFFPI